MADKTEVTRKMTYDDQGRVAKEVTTTETETVTRELKYDAQGRIVEEKTTRQANAKK